jgi:23S rRNA (adenine-N6)-dimethyltransferase
VSGGARRRAELGQHFLAGGWLAAELVEQAGVGPGDLVLEIGAGSGVLTEALARRAGRVVAVEYDPPFGATAAMLRRLLGDPRTRLERADLILQKQAAMRYAAARPGTPETIRWGAFYELGTGRRLGPGCFRPPPRVGAAVLVARRRRPPLVPITSQGRFAVLLRTAFRHPGLPLRRSLVPPLTYRQLRRLSRDLSFPLDARPADLDAAQWAGLLAVLERS